MGAEQFVTPTILCNGVRVEALSVGESRDGDAANVILTAIVQPPPRSRLAGHSAALTAGQGLDHGKTLAYARSTRTCCAMPVGASWPTTASILTIQAYLGHKSIQHTARYTELAAARFKSLIRD